MKKKKKKKKHAHTVALSLLVLLICCIGIVFTLLIKASYDSHQLRHPMLITQPVGGLPHAY